MAEPGDQTARQTPQAAPIPLPYVPTDAEEAYMAACAAAITAGCQLAETSAAGSDADSFLKAANGVKSLVQAYEEIRTGGKVSTGHQGS